MKTYILKLKATSTTNYNLYDGTTLVSDSNLATLFGSAGEAYFQFDFNSFTPTNTTSLTILDSQDTAVITNTGLTGIAEGKNFKGVWGDSATAFSSFAQLPAYGLDESQLGELASLAKEGKIKEIEITDNTNMWDSALYPDGIYHVVNKASSGGEKSIYLSSRSGGKSVPVVNGSATYAVLLSDNTYGNRILIGIANKGTISSNTPPGMVTAIYASGSTSATKIFDGEVVNNLSYNDTDYKKPLSAYQGKVLNDKIEGRVNNGGTTAPTTSTAGTVGQLYSYVDTTGADPAGHLAICTAVSGSTYTWQTLY